MTPSVSSFRDDYINNLSVFIGVIPQNLSSPIISLSNHSPSPSSGRGHLNLNLSSLFTLMPLFKYSANHFQFSSSSSETETEDEDGDKCRKSHFPSKAEGGTI